MSNKECTLYVEGMHCAACEVLIEQNLLENNNFKSVKASLAAKSVKITGTSKEKINLNKINKEFQDLGYRFSTEKQGIGELFTLKKGILQLNIKAVKSFLVAISIVVFIFFGFFLFDKSQLGSVISVSSSSSLPMFFILGLVAGVSSCAALVGTLILSLSKKWDESSENRKLEPHFAFHAGRIASFFILGGLLGLISEKINFNNTLVFSILTIAVSLIMFVLALQMLNVEFAYKIKISAPKFFAKSALNSSLNGKFAPFAIGASTFFLPCGFTLIAQSVALVSGSFLQGALIMLFFTLGTLPLLAVISFTGVFFNSSKKFNFKFNYIAGIIIIVFVVYNINAQLNVLGLPSLSNLTTQAETPVNIVDNNMQPQDAQVIKLVAKGFEYTPVSPTTIKAGIKTTLEVDNQGITGCATFIASRGLISNYVELKKGKNIIDLGTPNKGTYKITCSMGMVSPVIINVV